MDRQLRDRCGLRAGIRRKTRIATMTDLKRALLIGLAVLLATLAAGRSEAGLVRSEVAVVSSEAADDAFDTLSSELLLDAPGTDAVALAAVPELPLLSQPTPDPKSATSLHDLQAARPGMSGNSSIAPVGGGGTGVAAIPNAICGVPRCGLETRVVHEALPVLTTGPPFELLRPA